MARLLSMQKLPLFLLVVLMGVFSIFSIINFLCSSHDGKRSYKREKNTVLRLGDKKPAGISKLGSNLSSKALLMAKMISWRKVQDEGGQEEGEGALGGINDDEAAVWKKTIMMGERCRPIEFSGKILYDENGNPIPNTPPPSHNTGNI